MEKKNRWIIPVLLIVVLLIVLAVILVIRSGSVSDENNEAQYASYHPVDDGETPTEEPETEEEDPAAEEEDWDDEDDDWDEGEEETLEEEVNEWPNHPHMKKEYFEFENAEPFVLPDGKKKADNLIDGTQNDYVLLGDAWKEWESEEAKAYRTSAARMLADSGYELELLYYLDVFVYKDKTYTEAVFPQGNIYFDTVKNSDGTFTFTQVYPTAQQVIEMRGKETEVPGL